jgi:hypothetical protein
MMQQNQMIDPAREISITLPAGHWDQVLNILGDGPWKVVAHLIQKIVDQAQAQGGGAATAPAPNGHLHDRQGQDLV